MNQRETTVEIRATVSILDVLQRMGVAPDGRGRVATTSIGLSTDDPSCVLTVSPETPERSWRTTDGRIGGDVVDLVQTVTGASLDEALALLTLGGRIPIASTDREPERSTGADHPTPVLGRTPAARVEAVNEAAWHFYTEPAAGARARRRLLGWGILPDGLEQLERRTGRPAAGHTPLSSTGLLDHLQEKGFSGNEVLDAGWASRRVGSGDLVDRYRNRILLPYLPAHPSAPPAVIGATGTSVSWASGATHPRVLEHERTAAFRASAAVYHPWWEPSSSDVVVTAPTAVDALAIVAAAAAAGAEGQVSAVHVPSRAVAGVVETCGATTSTVAPLPLGLSPLDWLRSAGTAGLDAFTAVRAGACTWAEEAGT